MTRIPRTAAFKKKVALEALKENHTLHELAQKYGVHPMQISTWKKELIEGAENVFLNKRHREKSHIEEKEALERMVGQLTLEIDFLKKKLGIWG